MPQQTDNDPRFLLVDESVLPEVFAKVVEAKDLLRSGRASTAAQAARLAGEGITGLRLDMPGA